MIRNRLFHGFVAGCLAVWTSGCGSDGEDASYSDYTDANEADAAEFDHGHEEGPHGGHLMFFGDEHHHVEVTFDEETRGIDCLSFA